MWGKPRTSSLGGHLSAFCERLAQRSTELSCTRFDGERSRKSKAIDEQRYGTIILREHSSPRTCLTVVRVQVVGVCEIRTLADMPGLVIVLDNTACCWCCCTVVPKIPPSPNQHRVIRSRVAR